LTQVNLDKDRELKGQYITIAERPLCADGSRPSSVYERLLWGKQTLRILLSVAANNLK
jgi:hypothetical protein